MKSVRLIPNQILDAAHNIRNIRNAITHNIQVKSFDDLEGFKPNLIKTLIHITNTYQGDYDTYYERIEDTMKNRFKSTCMNVISALRYFEPSIKAVRGVLDSHQYQSLIKEEENPEFPNSDGIV